MLVAEFLRTGCKLVLEAKRQIGRDLLGVRAEKRQLTIRVCVVSCDDDVGNTVVGALQKILEIGETWRFELGEKIGDRIRQLAAEDEGLRCGRSSPLGFATPAWPTLTISFGPPG